MSFFSAIESQILGGGWVNICLLLLAMVLFYLLGYRFVLLKLPIAETSEKLFFNGSSSKSILNNISQTIKLCSHKISEKEADEILLQVKTQVSQFSGIVNTLVSMAPLLGLLGTVIGMIETFSSLGDNSLFSASGGVAGGISQALITTQVGLIIAIPGLFISRYLKRLEEEILLGTQQMIELKNNHMQRGR